MKTHLTLEFDDFEELRSFLDANPDAPVSKSSEKTDEPNAIEPDEKSLDADGMPYSDEYHANPPQFTADGKWRAKRGAADEAKAARAAFLAAGGNVEPPEVEDRSEEPDLGLPDGLPESAPEPVSYKDLIAAVVDAKSAGKFDGDVSLPDLYEKHGGSRVAADAGKVLQSNETARAAFLADVQAL